MNTITRHIFLLALVMLAATVCGKAQQSGVYIPKSGKVFFNGDTATIFSNVINDGKLGVGKKAVLNFKGKKWKNDANAQITDDANGGEDAKGQGGHIRFNGKEVGRQQVEGGYNQATKQGATFSTIQIDNAAGVELENGTTKIRHELQLKNGKVYVQDNILVVGDGYPGTISGYDSSRFIVAGGNANAGMLVRENVRSRDSWVVFPIGSQAGSYTPLSVKSNVAQGDDFHARVLDGVKKDLWTGADLTAESVNKTWEVGKRYRLNMGETEIALQHLTADEGSIFKANREFTYISQYLNNGWDSSGMQKLPAIGNITTGQALQNAGVNNRKFEGKISRASYFTKLTGKGDVLLKKTRVWFNAYRTDRNNVLCYWTTNPEVNVRYFVVQRRLANETKFVDRGSQNSKSVTLTSNSPLNYNINDPNSFNGLSYYRLKLIGYNGDSTFTNIVVVGPKPGGYELLIWPNPSPGRFFIGINGAAAVKYVCVFNVLGQLVQRELVNERAIIEMNINLPGSYFVSFISHSGQLLETKKLLITGQ